jgi:ferredoxin-NADP reductase
MLPARTSTVGLTAEDGDQAERAYAIASAPSAKLALTVEREVSSHLTGSLRVADGLELRSPIGGPSTWRVDDDGPLLLVADGSGLVPLMAMLRHRAARSSTIHTPLLLSTRSPADVLSQRAHAAHGSRRARLHYSSHAIHSPRGRGSPVASTLTC